MSTWSECLPAQACAPACAPGSGTYRPASGCQPRRSERSADNGQGLTVGQNVVRLNPAARIVKVLFANIRAGRHRLVLQNFTGRVRGAAGRHQHARTALRGSLRVQNMPLGFVQQLTHDSVGGAHLLQAENVDVTARQPRRHILLVGGSDTVHIHARHAKQTARARCRGVRKMHSS